MALIQCKNVSLAYDGTVVAEQLDFSVQRGEYLCIVGENGSGKSTLVKGLLGLMRPLTGEIEYGDGLTQRDIGYVPQQTNVQKDFPASVREVVLSGTIGRFGHSLFYTAEQKSAAYRAMDRLGIRELEKCCYRELSGGQQQRVRLASFFCWMNPPEDWIRW